MSSVFLVFLTSHSLGANCVLLNHHQIFNSHRVDKQFHWQIAKSEWKKNEKCNKTKEKNRRREEEKRQAKMPCKSSDYGMCFSYSIFLYAFSRFSFLFFLFFIFAPEAAIKLSAGRCRRKCERKRENKSRWKRRKRTESVLCVKSSKLEQENYPLMKHFIYLHFPLTSDWKKKEERAMSGAGDRGTSKIPCK